MISVTIYLDETNCWEGFSVKGHSDFAESGHDIFCAGVSSLTQTAILSISILLDVELGVHINDGDMQVHIPKMSTEVYTKCELLCESMLLGLNEIAKLYPENLTISKLKESEHNGA